MHFSKYGALMGLLGSAAATTQEVAPRTFSSGSCSSDLTTSWEDETFYSG